MRPVENEAYVQLRRGGRLDVAGVELLKAVVESVVGARRATASYPNLDNEWSWSDADVATAVHEFYAYLGESGNLNTLAAECVRWTHP